MEVFLISAWTLFWLGLGAVAIVMAGLVAIFVGPLYGAEKLGRWVWTVYTGVISWGFAVKDPQNRRNTLSQPGVHLWIANHPPTITTLIFTAWVGVLMRGRVVIVMREVSFVHWVMKVTGVGVFIRRGGSFDQVTFQREVQERLGPHEDYPVVVVYFPDRSRPRLGELEADHARARQKHCDIYDAARFPAHLHTRVPRVTGLEVLFVALPSDTTVTQVIVGHKGIPGWAVKPWGVWRPLVVRLVPAQDLFHQQGDVLRLSLYKAWAEAADTLERWATAK